MGTGYTLKKFINHNSIIFFLLLSLFLLLQSHTHFSTALLSILPPSQEKSLLKQFEATQGAKTLLLAVKGFDEEALQKIKSLEKQFYTIPNLVPSTHIQNERFQQYLQTHALYTNDINQSRLKNLDAKEELNTLFEEMTGSFFHAQINKLDPFSLMIKQNPPVLKLKNMHLILEGYGYLSLFSVQSDTLVEHVQLYNKIHASIGVDDSIKVFSPIFYYVENSQAIRTDVNKIILLSFTILLLLYLFILRNIALLFNTLLALASSALLATIVLTSIYDEVSIFVFVFGVSISTVAIDYMFHHYLHGYYSHNKTYNKEVLFGLLTTLSAFVIIGFTSFLLIRQISLFAILSLLASYLHFSFLFPKIGFKSPKTGHVFSIKSFHFFKVVPLFIFSLILILTSSLWIHFDFNLKNLDYNNTTLKETQNFFSKALRKEERIPFAVKAKSLNTLINHAKQIRQLDPYANIPLANFRTRESDTKNTAILHKISKIREDLKTEASRLGFKKGYFKDAYLTNNPQANHTLQSLKMHGIDIFQGQDYYVIFAQTDISHYAQIKKLDFVYSLSLKERFEAMLKQSVDELIFLGILALCVIFLLLYVITRNTLLYAVIFLLFPIAMISLYGLFISFNILHIFMLFIILSIGIDYAIYLSKSNGLATQHAIAYSLLSTFAGFGVLIFSQINALGSLGTIATIGIVSIFILLIGIQRSKNASSLPQ